jgi:hypothetical protein
MGDCLALSLLGGLRLLGRHFARVSVNLYLTRRVLTLWDEGNTQAAVNYMLSVSGI